MRIPVAVLTIASMNMSASWVAVDENGDPLPRHCVHLDDLQPVESPPPQQCLDCLREGSTWVHLRQCLTCGIVRCCDDSPRRHASAHARTSGHAVVRSAEPDETWAWCYPEELFMLPVEAG